MGTIHRRQGEGGALRWEGVAPERYATISAIARSEEHTSELQSPYDLVCRLLLEKKKKNKKKQQTRKTQNKKHSKGIGHTEPKADVSEVPTNTNRASIRHLASQ